MCGRHLYSAFDFIAEEEEDAATTRNDNGTDGLLCRNRIYRMEFLWTLVRHLIGRDRRDQYAHLNISLDDNGMEQEDGKWNYKLKTNLNDERDAWYLPVAVIRKLGNLKSLHPGETMQLKWEENTRSCVITVVINEKLSLKWNSFHIA